MQKDPSSFSMQKDPPCRQCPVIKIPVEARTGALIIRTGVGTESWANQARGRASLSPPLSGVNFVVVL